jgi:hypothetical protein
MRRLKTALDLLAVAAATLVADRGVASIVVGPSYREVYTFASAFTVNNEQHSFTDMGGMFDELATSSSTSSSGAFFVNALQSSNLPATAGPLISGSGSAGMSSTVVAFGGGVAYGDAILDLTFNVDASASYTFAGNVSFAGEPEGNIPGAATILFYDDTNFMGIAFIEKTDADPGADAVSLTVALQPGIDYRLFVAASVGEDPAFGGFYRYPNGLSTAEAVWSFSLTPLAPAAVPEATQLATWSLLSGMGLATILWRRRRR